MNEKLETKQYVYSVQCPLADSLDVALIAPALSGADWGRRAKVSAAEVLYFDEDGPTRYVQSWAPTKVIPTRTLVKSDLGEILQWLSEHRGISCHHVRERVSIVTPQPPAGGLLKIAKRQTLEVWRTAYDWNERPLLVQLETRHPYLPITYDRYLPWEQILERQRAKRECRVPA